MSVYNRALYSMTQVILLVCLTYPKSCSKFCHYEAKAVLLLNSSVCPEFMPVSES